MLFGNNIHTILLTHISQIFLHRILIIIMLLINNSMVYKECIINSNNIPNLTILLQGIMEVMPKDMLCINSMTNNRHHPNINSNNRMEVNTDLLSTILVVGTIRILQEEADTSLCTTRATRIFDSLKCRSSPLGISINTEISTPNNMWM